MKRQFSSSIYNKYPPNSTFNGRRVLNLGCGFAVYAAPNVTNLDAYGQPDLLWDLRKVPLPLESESFDFVIANHILEHLPHERWWALFEDCARILKPNGTMEIWVPGGGSDSIFGFRDHCCQIGFESFYGTFGTYRSGFNSWAAEHQVSPANSMKLVGSTQRLPPFWWLKGPRWWKDWCSDHLRNVTYEQAFFFRKVTAEELDQEMKRCPERFTNEQS